MSTLKIQITQASGDWDTSSLGCYISHNNDLLDIITPLNSQHSCNIITVPLKGMLKFYVKTMGNSSKFIGTVTTPIELLPHKGSIWLPLFQDSLAEPISSIPTTVNSPKLLICINNETVSQIIEPTSQNILNNEFAFSLQENQVLLKQERESRELIQNEYLKLQISNKKLLTHSNIRESSLISLLEQKDIEIQHLKVVIEKSESNLKLVLEERNGLATLIDELKSIESEKVILRLTEELEISKRLIEESSKQKQDLLKYLGTEGLRYIEGFELSEAEKKFIEFKEEISRYDKENKKLRMILLQYESSNEPESGNKGSKSQEVGLKEIESALLKLGLLKKFKKAENCYEFAGVIVQIFCYNEKLIIKNAAGIMPIDEFITIYEENEGSRSGKSTSRKSYNLPTDSKHPIRNFSGEIKPVRGFKTALKDKSYPKCNNESKPSVNKN